MAMARALRDAGQPAEGRAPLAPVYAQVTQRFGTPRLVEAKAYWTSCHDRRDPSVTHSR
jgi:hypothetical protein